MSGPLSRPGSSASSRASRPREESGANADGGLSLVQPEPEDDRALMLANFVAANNAPAVKRVIAKDPGAVNELGLDGTSPLCAAAMWGNDAMLRLLLEAKASPGVRNDNGPRWTPLHAAALQEHGKACMLLLEHKASPQDKDAEGVTALDYASCSEAVWPFFAQRGCERTPKATLVEKGVLRKASSNLEQELHGKEDGRGLVPEYSRPGSAYVVSKEFPARPGSVQAKRLSSSHRSNSRPIDILEEVDETKELRTTTTGFNSLTL